MLKNNKKPLFTGVFISKYLKKSDYLLRCF